MIQTTFHAPTKGEESTIGMVSKGWMVAQIHCKDFGPAKFFVVDINGVAFCGKFAQTRGWCSTSLIASIPLLSFHLSMQVAPGSVFPSPFKNENKITFLLLHLHPRANDSDSSGIIAWSSRHDPDSQFCIFWVRSLWECE